MEKPSLIWNCSSHRLCRCRVNMCQRAQSEGLTPSAVHVCTCNRVLVVTTMSSQGPRTVSHGSGACCECHEAMEATQLLREMLQGVDQQEAQAQLQQQQAQKPQGAPPTATAGMEKQFQHQQLNLRGFDKIEALSGGEDRWQNWLWNIKTAVSWRSGE